MGRGRDSLIRRRSGSLPALQKNLPRIAGETVRIPIREPDWMLPESYNESHRAHPGKLFGNYFAPFSS